MMTDFFELYEAIAAGVDSGEPILRAHMGRVWAMAETAGHTGIAMATPGESIAPLYESLAGLSLREAARAVGSWNLREASLAMAAANCHYNSPERMEKLRAFEPFDNYCTAGIDFEGMTVGLVGHLRGPEDMRKKARQVYIIERQPQPGDYPDAACDWILPQCDIVLITGSSIINKTLPHLLELCRDAYTILTGPTVPLCPALLDFGIDRLAGMAVTDREGMQQHVLSNAETSPYPHGQSFLLKR